MSLHAGAICRPSSVLVLALLIGHSVTCLAQNAPVAKTASSQPQLVAQLGHPRIAGKVAFSPDGRFLLTTGRNWSNEAILWDVATGLELYRLKGNQGFFLAAAFSHDGRFIVTGSNEGIVNVWEVSTGQEVERFVDFKDDSPKSIKLVAFSPDDRYIIVGAGNRAAVVHDRWDTTPENFGSASVVYVFERSTRTLIRKDANLTPLAISSDGRRLLIATPENVELKRNKLGVKKTITNPCVWDIAGWQTLTCIPAKEVIFAAFSANAEWLVLTERDSEEYRTAVWDTRKGEKPKDLPASLYLSAISPDGRQLLAAGKSERGPAGGLSQKVDVWDVSSGQKLRELDAPPFLGYAASVQELAFSSDGRYAAAGRGDGTTPFWEVETGKEVRRFEGQVNYVMALAVSEDGQHVDVAKEDESIYNWDLNAGHADLKKAGTGRGVPPDYTKSPVVSSPDGRLILQAKKKSAVLIDGITKQELRSLIGHSDLVLTATFSRDGRMVATGSFDATTRLWDTSTGQEIRTLTGHLAAVLSIVFTSDGRRLITGSTDGTMRFWDIASGREICRAIVFVNGDWAVMDPSGRFDASNGGKVEGLHWVVNNEPIVLSQLKERYYEPGLLAKLLGFNKEPLRDVSKFENPKLNPDVKYEVPAKGSSSLTVTLTNRGGGIGRVQVFLNGKEFLADARDEKLKKNPNIPQATLNIDLLKATSTVTGKDNEVRVVAWNVENYISSRSAPLAWKPAGAASTAAPEVFAIVGGISNYAGAHLNLNFAAKDAVDVANAIELGAKRLFGAERVHLTLLSTTEDSRSIPPTKDNFTKAFAAVRARAKPTDILIVYLAGHGITLQRGSDTYCYLTQEARTTDTAVLADSAVRQQTTITSEELVEWIKQIPALKQVLMLDTCAAGAAQAQLKLVDKREASGDAIRAIDRAKDRTGSYILMGSAADAVSYEASQYGQGLLTYALLKGMKGAALRNDEFVDVSKLFQFARDEVEQLAKNVGGIQKPIIFAPKDDSFEVGQLKREDKQRITLSTPRPMILRPRFLDAEVGDDTLDLMRVLRARLRDETFIAGVGENAVLLFVDDEEFPGALRPTGTYTVEGQTVTVKLSLRRDGVTISSFRVSGTKEDVSGLAAKILEAVKEAVRKL
ncbi:MAG: caspase family protein [Pyrinomonadaceae bacterium]